MNAFINALSLREWATIKTVAHLVYKWRFDWRQAAGFAAPALYAALRRGGCLPIAFQQRSGCTPADELLGRHRMNIFDAIDGNLDAMAMDQPKNTDSIIICRTGPTRLTSLTGARYSRNKRLRRRAKTCHFLSSLDRRKRLRLPLTTAVRERWDETFRSSRVDD